ncbi:Protein kinase, catalytic domain-containing protein [Sesbania bispinosa]|nr:Protein kinase, catalytic domain-containing protein [Sesbania bispinosa]
MRYDIHQKAFKNVGRNTNPMIEVKIVEWDTVIAKRKNLTHRTIEGRLCREVLLRYGHSWLEMNGGVGGSRLHSVAGEITVPNSGLCAKRRSGATEVEALSGGAAAAKRNNKGMHDGGCE